MPPIYASWPFTGAETMAVRKQAAKEYLHRYPAGFRHKEAEILSRRGSARHRRGSGRVRVFHEFNPAEPWNSADTSSRPVPAYRPTPHSAPARARQFGQDARCLALDVGAVLAAACSGNDATSFQEGAVTSSTHRADRGIEPSLLRKRRPLHITFGSSAACAPFERDRRAPSGPLTKSDCQ